MAVTTAELLGWAKAEDVPADVLHDATTTTTTTTTVPVDVQNPDLSSYDVVFALDSGSFGIGAAGTVALPDGDPASEGRTYLVGTWDRTSGALELQLLVPDFTTPVDTSILPDPIPVTFEMRQLGTGLGSLDPATGAFRLDIDIDTRLTSPEPVYAGFLGTDCVMGPASLTLRSDAPFDLSATEPAATVADSGFAFPAAHGCGDNGDLDQVLNPALELPTTDTSATMHLSMIKGAPAATQPTTTTTSLPPSSSTTIGAPTSTESGTSTSAPSTTTSSTTVPTSSSPSTAVPPSTSESPASTASTATSSTLGNAGTDRTQRAPGASAAPPARPVSGRPTYTG